MEKYISELVNGSLDGLITSFSLVSASLGSSINKKTLLILAITGILVDAYSMGISRYLSEKTDESDKTGKTAFMSGLTVAISFVIFGAVPIIPLIVSQKNNSMKILSIFLSLLGFYFIGAYKGSYDGLSPIKNGLETLFMGLTAAFLSYFVSSITSSIV